jgi:hypothetical protein
MACALRRSTEAGHQEAEQNHRASGHESPRAVDLRMCLMQLFVNLFRKLRRNAPPPTSTDAGVDHAAQAAV